MTAAPRRDAGPSIRDSRRQMYRQQILIAAEFEFAKQGFATAKVNAIAAAADVSLATVYKNFKGKDEIWDVLQAQRMNELLDTVRSATADCRTALEALLQGTRAQVTFFANNPNFLALHVREGFSWATATRAAEAGRGSQRMNLRTGLEMLTQGVEAAVAAGELAPRKPTIIAGLMISALQVWLTDWVVSGRQTPADTVADELIAYLAVLLPITQSPKRSQATSADSRSRRRSTA